MATKKWTVVDYDAAKYMKSAVGSKLKRVKLPATMQIQVVAELDEEIYKKISKDPSWLAKIQQGAAKQMQDVLKASIAAIESAEAKSLRFDKKTAQIFTRDLQSTLQTKAEAASTAAATAVQKLLEDYKKGQKELTKFRCKTAGKIALTAVTVSAGTAISVATAGALSPIGILSIVRGAVTIGQEITKLALTADQIAKLIKADLTILKRLMITENAVQKKKSQNFKEMGLNALAVATGIQTTSIKNCDERIKIHKVDIAKIEKKSHELSKKIYEVMDEQKKWAQKYESAKANLPAKKVGKISTHKAKIEQALDALIKSVIKINERIEKAKVRQGEFDKAINAMKQGLSGWVKYVDVALGVVLDLATGLGDASSAIERGATVLLTEVQLIGSELIDPT